jgi:hypothetical protein
MRLMLAALIAKFFEFKALSRFLLVLVRKVVAIFALSALKNDIVSHGCST